MQTQLTVLLVDDDSRFLKSFGSALRRRRIAVYTANSPQEALATARTVAADVAAVDIMLGDTSGWDLIPKLRVIAPKMKIFAISGYPFAEPLGVAMRSGAIDFLSKLSCCDELLRLAEAFEPAALATTVTARDTLRVAERRTIVDVLRSTNWNLSRAALSLGVSRSTIKRKIDKYKLTDPD